VFANRLVGDGVVGDAPIQSLARMGGSSDYYVYGGMDSGRGIRVQRYLGKLRLFEQAELRWRFFDTEFLGQQFGFTAVGFADVGVVGAEVALPDELTILPGFGGGVRVAWNENFIVRLDVAASPLEHYEPATYLLIGHPF
jgi:hemolysin activation/secretion protein